MAQEFQINLLDTATVFLELDAGVWLQYAEWAGFRCKSYGLPIQLITCK